MSKGWVAKSLGELIDVKHGFAFKGEYFSDKPCGDFLLTPGNFAIGGGFKADKVKYYKGPVDPEYVLSEGDLIVTMTDLSKSADTLGYPAIVPSPSGSSRYLHNQRLGKVTIKNPNITDLRFLYYLMCSQDYRHEVISSATGTTVKHTSPDRIKLFRFLLPTLRKQQSIGYILGILDDKIELNRQMNETLENIAKVIFKSWFIDFDPVHAKTEGRQVVCVSPEIADLFPDSFQDFGCRLPTGWLVKRLADVTSYINRGVSPKYIEAGGITVINQKCIREGRLNLAAARQHDESAKPVDSKKLFDGDILVNSTGVGTLGRVAQVFQLTRPCIVDSHVTVIRSNPEWISPTLLGLHMILMQPEIELLGEGSTGQTELNRERLKNLPIITPTKIVQAAFDQVVCPIKKRIVINEMSSETLASMRDILLPKLLSGEIRIKDAEKMVEAVV